MSNLKKTAKELASHGRYGDTMLLHVSKDEVRGLASLLSDGKLPTNPKTGLPEAWFFLPFLASLFGGAAAAAPAIAGTAAAGLGTAAATGLGTAAAAAAPALAAGTGMAGLTAGLTAGAHGLAATAAPALAAPLGVAGAATAAPTFLGGLGSAIKGIGSGIGSLFGGGAPAAAGTTAGAGAGAPAATGLGGFMTKNMMPIMLGSQLLGPLFNKKSGGDEEEGPSRKDVDAMQYKGGDPVFPSGGNAGKGEWNFFPKRRFATGGIIDLAEGGDISQQMDIQMQPPQDMSFPLNGVPATPEIGEADIGMEEDIPESPFPRTQIGEEDAMAGDQEQELIMQTVEAIKGISPNPQPVLMAFIKTFGEDALTDLVARVRSQGGPPPGGDGMSDSVPAMIGGRQPAALSQGEYVVPADVVSGLGNGSTDAGASQLDQMASGVRTQRTGSPQQPPKLNAGGLVPGLRRY